MKAKRGPRKGTNFICHASLTSAEEANRRRLAPLVPYAVREVVRHFDPYARKEEVEG